MALVINEDYIFAPQVWDITDDGVLVGTQFAVYFVPTKTTEHIYRKIKTTDYSLGGQPVAYYLEAFLKDPTLNLKSLHRHMLFLQTQLPEIKIELIGQYTIVKVQAGFLGSGINIKQGKGKFGWKPFCQRLGAQKKLIKDFYT